MGVKKTCGDHGHTCKIHGRRCIIATEYDDGRQISLEAANQVPEVSKYLTHDENSVHFCDICSRERREARHPGYYRQDPLTQQILPADVITKRLKQEAASKAKREKKKKKAFGRRGRKK